MSAGAGGPLNSPGHISDGPEVASLTPQRWQQIKDLFSLALDQEPNLRQNFLRKACEGDESLRREVESLLESADDGKAATASLLQAISPQTCDPAMPEDPMPGRRIGAYCVDRRIGYGGMASVYLASRADQQFRMQVAIKVLRPDLDRAELLRRFLNERQTLAALNHPNIVKLLDGGSTEEGLPYLLMEYIEGTPIDEYCDSQCLSIQRRLQLFLKVCDAVEYAHCRRVIHRDLKPNNILVTSDGTPKLLDFGIAKVLEPREGSDITHTANRHLTPAYASPEQVRGEPITSATDVYSLGVVLYVLLTGHRPYRLKQRSPAAVERAICEQEPESPSTAVDRVEVESHPDGTTTTVTAEMVSRTREGQPHKLRRCLRGDLDNIVLRALQKGPRRRYGSAQELAADIERHLNHQPVEARATSLAYSLSRLASRHGKDWLAAGIAFAMLATALGFLWKEHSATEHLRAEVSSQRGYRRRSIAVLGFKNLSGRSDAAWLSTALSEMLTTELSAEGKLLAISGDSVSAAKVNLSLADTESFSPDLLRQLYRSLGSDYVVVGSYLHSASGGNVRLDLHIQDAALASDVASLSEVGDLNALPDLMAHVAARVRERLEVPAVKSGESESVRASLQSNPEAMRLYAEGLSRLRIFDAMGARDLLQQALTIDPKFALAHAALAAAWSDLGYETKKREESKQALELAGTLPREQFLAIQARYFQDENQWDKAAEVYRALFTFFPDNLDYGLRLARMQTFSGRGPESLETCAKLHNLPAPYGQDPRIDLAEAEAQGSNHKLAAEAADRAISGAEKLGTRLVAADALIVQGEAFRSMSNFPKAQALALRAKDLSAAAGDRFGVCRALSNLGAALCDSGDFASCKRAFEQALEIARDLGNRQAQGAQGTNLAIVLTLLKDYPHARQEYLDVIRLTQETGEGSPYQQLATLEKDIGDLSEANRHVQLSIRQNHQSPSPDDLSTLGQIRMAEGNPAAARRLLSQSLEAYRKSGDKAGEADMLGEIADVELMAGNLDVAKKLYLTSIGLGKEVGDRLLTASSLTSLGGISMLQDDFENASRQLSEAREIFGQINPRDSTPVLALARLLVEQEHAKEAEALLRQSLGSVYTEGNPNTEAVAEALMVDALLSNGNLTEAKRAAKAAQELVAKTGNREVQIEVALEQAKLLSASGNATAAQGRLRETLRRTKDYNIGSRVFEARLLLAQAEMRAGNVNSGRAELVAVERDARAKGFGLIARKAAATGLQLKATAAAAFFK